MALRRYETHVNLSFSFGVVAVFWLCAFFIFFPLTIFISILELTVVRKSKAGEYSNVQGHEALFFLQACSVRRLVGRRTYSPLMEKRRVENEMEIEL